MLCNLKQKKIQDVCQNSLFWFSHQRVPGEATPIRGTVGMSLEFVTIVVIYIFYVICNYSCIYSYLLVKSIYLNAVLPPNCIFIVFILYLLEILVILIYCKSVHVF